MITTETQLSELKYFRSFAIDSLNDSTLTAEDRSNLATHIARIGEYITSTEAGYVMTPADFATIGVYSGRTE